MLGGALCFAFGPCAISTSSGLEGLGFRVERRRVFRV